MPQFGRMSLERLNTCDDRIHDIMLDVLFQLPWTDPVSGITIHDISILCGHRSEEQQDIAYKRGTTQVQWPDSNHNALPSNAADVAPYHPGRPHIHWNNITEMEVLSRLVLDCARKRNVGMRWGGDWDQDGVRVDHDPDERFLDGPHYELTDG